MKLKIFSKNFLYLNFQDKFASSIFFIVQKWFYGIKKKNLQACQWKLFDMN